MISNKLKLVEETFNADGYSGMTRARDYKCDVVVDLAGDSIWDCTIDKVRITSIWIEEGIAGLDDDGDSNEGYNTIWVHYTAGEDLEEEVEGSWRIYTDSGFERAVSELLGEQICFTEQGMQEDGSASMER